MSNFLAKQQEAETCEFDTLVSPTLYAQWAMLTFVSG
jgi:hypothetical protein